MLGDIADVLWELALLHREALVAWVSASPSFVCCLVGQCAHVCLRLELMTPNIVPERTKANFLQVIASFGDP